MKRPSFLTLSFHQVISHFAANLFFPLTERPSNLLNNLSQLSVFRFFTLYSVFNERLLHAYACSPNKQMFVCPNTSLCRRNRLEPPTKNAYALGCLFDFHTPYTIEYKLVGSSGLEPPTSRLSGARSNQLSYEPILVSCVLSTFGGDDGVRTHDPLLAGQVLSQLSYTPIGLGFHSK